MGSTMNSRVADVPGSEAAVVPMSAKQQRSVEVAKGTSLSSLFKRLQWSAVDAVSPTYRSETVKALAPIVAAFILSLAPLLPLLSGLSWAQETSYLIVSDGTTKYSYEEEAGWESLGFDDSNWSFVVAPSHGLCPPDPVPEGEPKPIWGEDPQEYQTIFVRRAFTLDAGARMDIMAGADDDYDLYINGVLIGGNHDGWAGSDLYANIQLQAGENVLAMVATDVVGACQSVTFGVLRPCECMDDDNDGYGDPACGNCTYPEWDCNDASPQANPGFPEGPFGDPSCSDALDNDCDWYTDTDDSGCCQCMDNDSDGYGDPGCENCAYPQWDCDNSNPNVNPGVPEGPFGDPSCSDALDNDCDWSTDAEDGACCQCMDNDTDGYGYPGCENCTYDQWDCDNSNPNVNPGVQEDCDNGMDDDCDGHTDGEDWDCPCIDDDGDGYGVFANPNCTYGWGWYFDCDDTNPQVNPGVQEGPFGDPSCSDTLDNDCDGQVDTEDSRCCQCIDNDSDGYGDPACGNCTYDQWDCDDANPNINRGAPEDCTNGIDDDCDGSIDAEDWDCPLLAVTDNGAGGNFAVLSASLETLDGVLFQYQDTADLSGKAWVHFSEDTGLLWIPDLLLRARTIDFSFPVWFWEITGTLEGLEAQSRYWYFLQPIYVDPSDGSFTTYLELDLTYVISAYINPSTFVEDFVTGWRIDSFEVSGTFVDMGDSDADGLNEYALTLHGPFSFPIGDWGEIPLLGDVSARIAGELNLEFVAELLSPDSCEQDNFPNEGQVLVPGEVQSHVIHPDRDVDWIQVAVLDGHEYTVETLNLVGSLPDTVLEVYDDTGSLITQNDDVDYYGGRYESRVSWTATYTGTYYVKARTLGGSSGHFDDQGGGPAFCSYDISFECSDLDGDGYGDPGCVLCTYAEADCDDTNPNVNPGAKEGPPWDPKCSDGIDNDCDGFLDNADPDCGTPCAGSAQASTYGASLVYESSDLVKHLAYFLLPLGAIVGLCVWRRKR